MTDDELASEVKQHLSQPAMNDLCWMLERGQRRRALGLLLREEGRWLSSADADRFLSLLVIELRNNLRRRVDALIIKARTLGAI